jgi:hypothetical protein
MRSVNAIRDYGRDEYYICDDDGKMRRLETTIPRIPLKVPELVVTPGTRNSEMSKTAHALQAYEAELEDETERIMRQIEEECADEESASDGNEQSDLENEEDGLSNGAGEIEDDIDMGIRPWLGKEMRI